MQEENIREIGRIISNSFYNMQEIRKKNMNQIRDIVRRNFENIPTKKPEKKKTKKEYEEAYKDKKLQTILKQLLKKKKISIEEHDLIIECLNMVSEGKKLENKYEKAMMKYVENQPIYTEFLEKIKGISAILSANILKQIGYCENFDNVAKLWAYAGLSVEDGKAVRRKRGELLNYSPHLKTLCWKIGDSFIKQRTKFFRKIYDKDKAKWKKKYPEAIENPEYKKTKKGFKKLYTDGHIDAMARRKMVKLFLAIYWSTARELKKLPTRTPYAMEKLKHQKIYTKKDVI